MARKSALRAVDATDEAPVAGRVLSLSEAAASGSQLDLLRAVRDRIAETIEGDCPARDLASLTKRLVDVSKEIKAIEAREGEGADDESGGADDEAFDPETI